MKGNIYNFKWFYLFIVYAFLYAIISWLTNNAVYTDSYYHSSIDKQLDAEKIINLIQIIQKYQIWGYSLLPIVLLIKWTIIAGIINAGLYFFNQKISFAHCFRIAMIAELATIVAGCIRLLHFLIHKPQSIEDVQFFYPLSLTELFNPSQLPDYLIYPLQQLNILEIVYWLLITVGIKVHIQKTFSYSFKITTCSYGFALVLWVFCVMFIQLQFS